MAQVEKRLGTGCFVGEMNKMKIHKFVIVHVICKSL